MPNIRLLLPIRQHPHKSRTLDGVLQHLLMLQTRAGVVALADIAEVIDEGSHGWIVLVVDVLRSPLAEFTGLESRIAAALLGFLEH